RLHARQGLVVFAGFEQIVDFLVRGLELRLSSELRGRARRLRAGSANRRDSVRILALLASLEQGEIRRDVVARGETLVRFLEGRDALVDVRARGLGAVGPPEGDLRLREVGLELHALAERRARGFEELLLLRRRRVGIVGTARELLPAQPSDAVEDAVVGRASLHRLRQERRRLLLVLLLAPQPPEASESSGAGR